MGRFLLSAMASTENQTESSFQCPVNFHFDPIDFANLKTHIYRMWMSVAAINGVVSVPTVLINFLVIWTVLGSEQLRSKSYYLLIAILSFSDLLVGLFLQPLLIAVVIGFSVQYEHLCQLIMVYLVGLFLCYGLSVVAMVIISLERYLFIEHPLYYQTSVTSKKLMIGTAALWLVVETANLASRSLVNNTFWAKQFPVILTIGPSFIIILFCVTRINLTARRQMRAITAQQQAVAAQQNKIKEYKRTFTLGLIVLASVACLCPMLIMKIVEAVRGNWIDDVRHVSMGISLTSLNLQAIINPIIYSLRLSEIRTRLVKKLCCNRS